MAKKRYRKRIAQEDLPIGRRDDSSSTLAEEFDVSSERPTKEDLQEAIVDIAQEGLSKGRRDDSSWTLAEAFGVSSGRPTKGDFRKAILDFARNAVRVSRGEIPRDTLVTYVRGILESTPGQKRKKAIVTKLRDVLTGLAVEPQDKVDKIADELVRELKKYLGVPEGKQVVRKQPVKPQQPPQEAGEKKDVRTIGQGAWAIESENLIRGLRNRALDGGIGDKYVAYRQLVALENSAAQMRDEEAQGLTKAEAKKLAKKSYYVILPEEYVGTADEYVQAGAELVKRRRPAGMTETTQSGMRVIKFLDDFEKGKIKGLDDVKLNEAELKSLKAFLKFYGNYDKKAGELAALLGVTPNPTIPPVATERKPAGGQTEQKTPSVQVPQTPAETGAEKRGAEKMASPSNEIKSISKKQLQKLTVNEALAALESGMLGEHSLSVNAARQLAQAVVTALGNRLPPQKVGGIDVAPNKDFFKSWVSEVRGTLSTDAEALALKLGQPAAEQQKRKTSTAQAKPAGGGTQKKQQAGGGAQTQPDGGGAQTQPDGGGAQAKPAGGGTQAQPKRKTSGKGGTGEKAAPEAKSKTADTGESAPPQTAGKPEEPEAKVEIKEGPKVAAEPKREDKKINIRELLQRAGYLDEKGRFISKRFQQPQQIKPGTVVLTEQQLKFLLRLGKRPGNEPLNKMIDDLWRGTKGKTEIPEDVMNKLMTSGPRLVRRQAKLAQQKSTVGAPGVEPKPVAEPPPRVSAVSETTVEAAPKGRLGTLRGIAPHALTFIGAVALTKLLEALSERKKPAEIPAFPPPQVPQQGVWQQPIFPMFPMPQQFLPQQNQQQIPMFQTLPIIGPPAVINLEAFQ